MRLSPYPATGTFDSRVLDAGQSVNWDALSWTADTPAGTGVALSVRTGNTPTPDGSWSGFNPVGSSGGSIGGNSRYLQYRVQLSTSDQGKTPTLSDVSASYTAGTDTHGAHDRPAQPEPRRRPALTPARTSRPSSASRWTRAPSTPRASGCAPRAPRVTFPRR